MPLMNAPTPLTWYPLAIGSSSSWRSLSHYTFQTFEFASLVVLRPTSEPPWSPWHLIASLFMIKLDNRMTLPTTSVLSSTQIGICGNGGQRIRNSSLRHSHRKLTECKPSLLCQFWMVSDPIAQVSMDHLSTSNATSLSSGNDSTRFGRLAKEYR